MSEEGESSNNSRDLSGPLDNPRVPEWGQQEIGMSYPYSHSNSHTHVFLILTRSAKLKCSVDKCPQQTLSIEDLDP